MSYIWMGYSTNTEFVYYIMTLVNQLTVEVGFALPGNLSRIASIYASIERLNNVLQSEELDISNFEHSEKPAILLKDVSFKVREKEILEDICLNITKPGLTVVTGPVGSGKSSLLKVILKEYQPVSDGRLNNI